MPIFIFFTNSWHCSDVRSFFSHNFVVLQGINVTGGLVLTKPCDLRTYLAVNVTCGLVLTKPCDLRTYLAINVTGQVWF